MARILVTGVGGPAGRAVAQLLLDRSHQVIGTDMQFVQLPGIVCFQVPPARDPAFLTVLNQIALQTMPDLLIPTVTEELPIVAPYRSNWKMLNPAIGASDAVEIANDKYHTCVQLTARHVAVPRFALPSMIGSSAAVTQLLGWPCLSKPRVSRGGRGVQVHAPSDAELLLTLDDRMIVQEFAPGIEYAPNLYIGREKATVVVLEKTRLKNGQIGNAAAVKRVAAPDIALLALNACRALGLAGPVDVDIRRRSDGTPVVLEINARFGANIEHAPEVLDALLREAGIA